MTIYSYKNIRPKVSSGCFIASSADLIGRVTIAKNSSLWFQVVVRGDVNDILVGENTNIQDLCMLHVTEALPLNIGKNVSVGHCVTLHACTIGDGCLIGMGATVLDGAIIGENSLVAAGSLVAPGKVFPSGSYIIGSPAVIKRKLTEEEISIYSNHYKSYIITKDEYLNEVKEL